jgi:cysteine-rich repeat protein
MGLGAFGVFPASIYAADATDSLEAVGDETGLGNQDPTVIIGNIINYALGFIGIILVCFMVYGGFVWMTAAGNAERVDQAKKILINAVIGLVIVLMSWSIASFVINSLLGATGGSSSSGSSSGGGSGSGGGLGGGSGSSFEITGFSPEGEVSIRNIVVRVTFSKTVDEVTVDGSLTIADASGTAVDGTFDVSGNTVRFTPSAVCPDPNADRFCFDENAAYTITATADVASSSGSALTCSTGSPCTATFTSGTLVDTEDPSVSVVVPESGDGIASGSTVDVQVSATDDAGVSGADFSIEDEWRDSISADGNPTEAIIDATLSTESFTNGERYSISVTVTDLAGNEDTDSVSVRARPEWCFNGVEDTDLGEEGVDCGGDSSSATYCGACDGGSCVADEDCSSGSCTAGVCEANPTISGISPESGAEGTYVTISGSDFSANTGLVLFTDAAGTGTIEAEILAECSEGWGDTEIIVAVPVGAGDGPITMTTANGGVEATDDDNGATVPNFDVNDVVMPNLCSLSENSGVSEDALRLEGANFGDDQGDATVIFSSTEAGSYTSWSSDLVGVTVPNAAAGAYDVAIVVNGNASNTISYTIEVPEDDVSTIASISPSSGGIGQYVTISGTNFGSRTGTVTFESADGNTATASIDFPDECADDFWGDDEVTIIVPEAFDNGDAVVAGSYTVYVTNNDGTRSTSTTFSVVDAEPTPGICSITSSGDVGDTITIAGDHFGTDVDTVTFYNDVTSVLATRWTDDSIEIAVPSGSVTGPVSVMVAGAESNALNFTVGTSEGGAVAATVAAAYAWSFSTGEIAEVPAIVSECSDDVVSAVPNEAFSTAAETCTNAVVYAEFTTLMNEASVRDAISVAKCTDSGADPCTATEAVAGAADVESSVEATRVTWVPSGTFDVNSTYRVTIYTTAVSTDAIALAEDVTWEFTTSSSSVACVVDRVTVAPASETLTEDGQTTGFSANAGTGCVVVDSSDYTWDWSVNSYSFVDFNATADDDCTGEPSACATLEALAEGETVVTATAINADGGGSVSDDAQLTVNFSDPYIISYWPDCTEACTNAEVGALFNTTMAESDIISGDTIALYACANELCTSLVVVDANPACVYSDVAQELCAGFAFDDLSLTAGGYYRVIVSGAIRSASGVALIRTNYGTDYSWTFRVREDSTLCSVERIELSPSSAVATAIGETAAFSADAFGAADSCSTSGQRLTGADYAWNWEDAANTTFPAIADNSQNTETAYSTAAWYTQSGELLDGGAGMIVAGCSESCTPLGSAAYEAVCGDGVLDQNADGSGEECDDGNTTDHDGCSSTCVYEGSPACTFTCSSTGATCSADSECVEMCDTSTSQCTVSGTACTKNSDCPYVASTCGTSGASCCGNAEIEVEYSADIAEDCDDGNLVDGDGCSAACLAEGSATVGATCGNGDIAYDVLTYAGEECDDSNNANGDGCSRLCLREGSMSSAATGGAECGDSVVTAPYETCDDGNAVDDDGCSSTCVREGLSLCIGATQNNCCGNGTTEVDANGGGEDCDGQEGCSSSCTFAGSSVSYSAPSVCGDGVSGLGEYASCESASASGDGNPDPIQVAYITNEASLEVSATTNVAIANISVTEPSSNFTATASWTLSCVAETDQDCSDPAAYGVGTSSCCAPRPVMTGSAPSGNDVCRNSALTATFDREMNAGSFVATETTNGVTTESYLMYAVLNLATDQECPEGYTTSSYLAMTWFQRAVATLKVFILGPVAEAAATTDCVVPISSFTQTAVGDGSYKITANTGIALEENSSYTLVVVGDSDTGDAVSEGVASALGAAMNGSESVTFVTGSDICTLDDVEVTDTDEDSPGVFTSSGETHAFTATAISYSGSTRQEIVGIADVYDWTWSSWSGSDSALFTVAQDSDSSDSATVTVLNDNGDAAVTATATITSDVEGGTTGDTVSGTEDVIAYLCENTWPDLASFPWSDDATGLANGHADVGASGYMNFSMSYCQDFGTDDVVSDDLPNVTPVLAPTLPTSEVLKEYLFQVDSSSTSAGANSAGDAIGVRVMSNADFLSPMAWYESKGFSGSPTKTTIDGFQAVTDGRSAYIAAANSTSGGLYSNIFVITYNEGASEETIAIYEQMLESASFLLNVSSEDDQDKITRDAQRLGDLKDIAIAVAAYGEENRACSETSSQSCSEDSDCPGDETCEAIVPTLSAGTAVRALASSAWGSWNSTFGGALDDDSLPTDPLNTYATCDGYNADTCVNQTTGAYSCPDGSQVYHYRAVGEHNYELATDLEYTASAWVNDLDDDTADAVTFYTSSYCDGDVYGVSSSCGDGIIGTNSSGATEVCEIGDVNAQSCATDDGNAGTANAECNSDCSGYTLSSDAVCSAGTCGDGVVDTTLGEECDDGSFNGDYGYCGSLCTYDDAEYCGDGVVSGGEACDCGNSTVTDASILADARPYGGSPGSCANTNGAYADAANTTCGWDCAGPASYCGDETVDELSGEECDGGSVVSADALCLNATDYASSSFNFCASDSDCETGEICEVDHTWFDACGEEYVCTSGDASYIGQICTNNSDCGTGGVCANSTVQTYRTQTCDSSCLLTLSTAVCSAINSCGDGVTDSNEECDDGNEVSTDACTTACTLNVCGDAFLYDGEEECDEGAGNGGGCSSAYGSTCTACSTTCHYTTSSGDFCGDGEINGDEYCDGADVPYVWFDEETMTTNGACDTSGDTWEDDGVAYTCRSVGMCDGGENNGEYCTASYVLNALEDVAGCQTTRGGDGECVMPVCGADCGATCPTSTSSTSLLLTSNQPGADAANEVDVYSYSSSSTSDMPNAATIEVPACTVAGNLVADVDFGGVTPPDVYVVFVTDRSGSMGTADMAGGEERLKVARDSIISAIGTLFDELGSTLQVGLVSYDSSLETSTVMGTSEADLIDAVGGYDEDGGGTNTYLGINEAVSMLDAVADDENVAKIAILLSDGAPTDSSSNPNDGVAGANAAAYALIEAGYELYSIALTSDEDLIEDMNVWSSNTREVIGSYITGGAYNTDNLIDYSYSGTSTEEISGAYESIVDSIVNGTAAIISSSDGDVVIDSGSVSDSHNIVLPWPSEFACDGVSETEVPIQITFRGIGMVNVSNVRVEYCAP